MRYALVVGLSISVGAAGLGMRAEGQRGASATASIGGIVRAADDGAVVPGAAIELKRAQGTQLVLTHATTDETGRFVASSLVPGDYELRVTADGFLPSNRQGSETGLRVTVTAGQTYAKADFRLRRTATIEGRVLDSVGTGISGVKVQVTAGLYVGGAYRYVPSSSQKPGVTDDQGRFRIINVPPGQHYLLATSGSFAERSSDPTFPSTFYPSLVFGQPVLALDIRMGQKLQGMDIVLNRGTYGELSGRVEDEQNVAVANALVVLVESDGTHVNATGLARTVSATDGRFVFRNVPEGLYDVQAAAPGPKVNFGRAAVEIAYPPTSGAQRRARSDVTISLRSGIRLEGRVVANGSAPVSLSDVRIRYVPMEFSFIPGPSNGMPAVVADGRFQVEGVVTKGVFRADAPFPWGLVSVAAGGREVIDSALDISTKTPGDISLVFSEHMGLLSGTVEGPARGPAPGASVVLFPINQRLWGHPSRFVVTTIVDSAGTFSLPPVPAGEYFVVAVPALEPLTWNDPQLLERLRGVSTRVALKERQRSIRTLALAPAR